MAARKLSVGLAQVTGEPFQPERNREATLHAARKGFDAGAEVVVLPELVIPGYVADRDRLAPIAEELEGPSVAAWRQLAADRGGYLCGGFCEREGDRLFNTAVVVGCEGVLLHYRKLHPFSEEKHCFAPGDTGLPVAELPFGKVGVCVCYDLRFVETLRALSLQGAELVLVPTAWVAGFDQRKWDANGLAPQANGVIQQANLDQVFVACASQAGTRNGATFLGSSVLVGPTGLLVAGPLPGTVDDLTVAEIDLDDVERAQHRSELIAPREDRRTDVYGVEVGGRVL
ncbi:MAG: nitrilase-related carbon-nitrogen hydrolase [Solirubrobacterales bacterium]